MRPDGEKVATDHDLMTEVVANGHHGQVESYKITINGQPIAALSSYEHRYALATSDHKTMKAVLRGNLSVDLQGHAGCYVFGTDVSGECTSIGLMPYGMGGYVTSYMGGYSRLHGDTYLSYEAFGTGILLKNAYIDGDEAVLEFANVTAITQQLTVYGTCVVK